MTKILYIPNGEYIEFLAGYEKWTSDMSIVNNKNPVEALAYLITNLNEDGHNFYHDWRTHNKLDFPHEHSIEEFEIIYD